MTTCTKDRECLFGEVVDGKMIANDFAVIVRNEWLKTAKVRNNVILDAFIVMPNHVHGIIILANPGVGATRRVAPTRRRSGPHPGSIGAIVGQFKSLAAKRINTIRQTPGIPV